MGTPGTPAKGSWSLLEETSTSTQSCEPGAPRQRGHSESPNSSMLPRPSGPLISSPGLCILSSQHPWCSPGCTVLKCTFPGSVCPCSPLPFVPAVPHLEGPHSSPLPGRCLPSLQTDIPPAPGPIGAPPPQRPCLTAPHPLQLPVP